MPIRLRPGATVPVYLKVDMDLPEATRPAFMVPIPNYAQSIELDELLAKADEAAKGTERGAINTALDTAISFAVSGVGNMSKDGKPLTLAETLAELTVSEKWELVGSILSEVQLAEKSRKNSASPPQSSTAASVPDAEKPASA